MNASSILIARYAFLQLAAEGLVGREEAELRELLRDRRAALFEARAPKIRPGRPCNSPKIDAAVAMESLVLDGEHGLNQMRRHLIKRNLVTPLLEYRKGRLAVAIEHDGGDRHVRERTNLPRSGRAKDDVADEGEERGEHDAASDLHASIAAG